MNKVFLEICIKFDSKHCKKIPFKRGKLILDSKENARYLSKPRSVRFLFLDNEIFVVTIISYRGLLPV